MLSNADLYGAGNDGIAVIGGVWDYDNLNQSPNLLVAAPFRVPKKFDPNFHFGDIFRFDRITNLIVRGVTFRNPTTYSCHLTRAVHFRVDDIRFDFTTWNPQPLNMDGIHLDGGCRYGRISNLHGTCFDDMVALNANDGCCSAYEGPISDIDIDWLYADWTHRGVRLLSTDPLSPVRRVTIRNIHIKTYRNAVALTHFFPDRPGRGTFDAIVVRDCFASSAPPPDFPQVNDGTAWPIVWVQKGCDVGNLVIENLCRHETYSARAPTIQVDDAARVEVMSVRNCRQTRSIDASPEFFRGQANVGELSVR